MVNLKFYAFITTGTTATGASDNRPRAFHVVARNFDEAFATAKTVAAPRFAAYAGLNGSLPGVHVHPLRQEVARG